MVYTHVMSFTVTVKNRKCGKVRRFPPNEGIKEGYLHKKSLFYHYWLVWRENGGSFDPLVSRSPPYECKKIGYPHENTRIMLLSTNLAREWLQIDTDLLLIITSAADDLSGGIDTDDLERPKSLEIDQDRLRT